MENKLIYLKKNKLFLKNENKKTRSRSRKANNRDAENEEIIEDAKNLEEDPEGTVKKVIPQEGVVTEEDLDQSYNNMVANNIEVLEKKNLPSLQQRENNFLGISL